MSTPRVKICGITRLVDAELAVGFGADAIGLVFSAESPRVVSREAARAIARAVPPLVSRVGVFVDQSPADVRGVVEAVGLDVVQLHGDEPVEAYHAVGARLVKAVRLDSDADVRRAIALPPGVMVLIDAVDRDRRGGTGRQADWARAAQVSRQRPVILAGGLVAENVGEAIGTVAPWAVDVSSGVEVSPGVKSPDRLRRFFAAVAAAPRGSGATTGV
jgi:phosphoribosylanthranilate isomerase